MPLTFQLSTTWEEAILNERKTCIEKATKACEVICSVIAPKDGEKLFQAIRDSSDSNTQLLRLSVYYEAVKEIPRAI